MVNINSLNNLILIKKLFSNFRKHNGNLLSSKPLVSTVCHRLINVNKVLLFNNNSLNYLSVSIEAVFSRVKEYSEEKRPIFMRKTQVYIIVPREE